ncbi:MAG: multicopper oxidase domain-containing protein [Candidatus Bathyarchaeia archaeon]
MRKLKNKMTLALLTTLTLSMLIGTIQIQPARAALPLNPLTIPKYVTPLVDNIPVYQPTNVTVGGVTVRQDYYVNVTQFTEQILPTTYPNGTATGWGPTTVWGYGGVCYNALTGVSLGYFRNSPSATFIATRGIPTKITWVNNLTDPISGALLNYLYPVDPTIDIANPNNIPMDLAMQQAMAGLAPPFPPGYNGSSYNWGNGTIANPNGWNAMSPVPIVTHVHGAEVFSGSDGGPNEWFTPNGLHGADYYTYEPTYPNAAVYYYNNTQEECTIWYHDHAMGLTRINVFSGLAGYYLVKDPANTIAPLLPTGANDVPLAIQDRSFYDNGQLKFDVDPPPNPNMHPYWVPEYFGDTMMVNGKTWPYLNVRQQVYRFRLLDGCNARFLNLSFSNGMNFTVIARDQGYLKAPVSEKSILMGPGMRAEILVNFTGLPAGTNITLLNDASAPFPGPGVIPDPNTVGQVMQFRVVASVAGPQNVLPAILNQDFAGGFPTLPAATVTRQRLLTLKEVMGMGGPLMVTLDGQHFMSPVSELPVNGTTETWMIANPTADAHPMHWHLVSFQLISRQPFDDVGYSANWTAINGNPPFTKPTINVGNLSAFFTGPAVGPNPDEQGWLDTVTMYPGQVTTIRIRYMEQNGAAFPFDPAAGPGYVWHCHIVDHEDNDMMRRQIVIQPSQLPTLENVIRTSANQVQYRSFNYVTNTWNTLATLPGGSVDTPASVIANGNMYFVVRGAAGQSLWFGSLNLTTSAFSGWTLLDGAAASAPALTTNGNILALVLQGYSTGIYYRTYNLTSQVWTAWQTSVTGATSDRPGAVLIGDMLHLAVRGYHPTVAAGNNTLWYGQVNVTSNVFTGWTALAGGTPSAPTLVQLQSTNALELVVRGADNQIWTNQWDGMAWLGWTALPSGATVNSPAAAIVNNNIYFVATGVDGTTLYYSSMNMVQGTASFTGWTAITGTTPSAPILTR